MSIPIGTPFEGGVGFSAAATGITAELYVNGSLSATTVTLGTPVDQGDPPQTYQPFSVPTTGRTPLDRYRVVVTGTVDGVSESHEAYAVLDAAVSSRAEASAITSIGDRVDEIYHGSQGVTLTSAERTAIGTAVWATTTRTLSSFGTLASSVATAVWGAATRTITGGTVSSVTNGVTLAASQPDYAPAKAGDAMTLTAGERTSIATAVWASTTRTLSGFGTLAADVATAVWSNATRTLTAVSDSAGVTTLLSRLSAARAGYIDKLNVSGTLAHTGNAETFRADVSGLPTAEGMQTMLDALQSHGDEAWATADTAGLLTAADFALRVPQALSFDEGGRVVASASVDVEALAEEISGRIDVGNPVVLPLQVANPRTGTPTRTIPALSQGLGRTDVLGPFLDANGAAVDLSSKALRLVFFSVDEDHVATGEWKYETGAGLTVTGDSSNQVQVQHDGDKHDVPGCYRYVLVNASDDVPLLKGTVEIEATAEDA